MFTCTQIDQEDNYFQSACKQPAAPQASLPPPGTSQPVQQHCPRANPSTLVLTKSACGPGLRAQSSCGIHSGTGSRTLMSRM